MLEKQYTSELHSPALGVQVYVVIRVPLLTRVGFSQL